MTNREAYDDFMRHWRWYKDHFGDNMDETFKAILEGFVLICERKIGKWEVKLMHPIAHLLICSNCEADINITEEEHLEYYKKNFRYCPYCGAKMEGVEDKRSESVDIFKAMQESAEAVRNSPQYDFSCVTELLADKEGVEE